MAFRKTLRDTLLTSLWVQLRKLAFHLFPALVAAAWNASALEPLPRFPIAAGPLAITRPVEPGKPFTVAGPRGAILGEQGGSFEAWQYPLKILSHFTITGELADYPVPIDISSQAASIEVAPAITTITYSHAAFTIKQRMFAVRGDSPAAVVVLFEIDSVRPMRLTFGFKPEMQRMWPAPNFGTPNAEWVANGGYYVLHTDNPEISAAIAMPHATPGILAPYQERPKTYPVELKLAFDPKTDSHLCFPLFIATVKTPASIPSTLTSLDQAVPELYRRTADHSPLSGNEF